MLTSVVPESSSRLALPVLASPGRDGGGDGGGDSGGGGGKGFAAAEGNNALLQAGAPARGCCSRTWRAVCSIHAVSVMNEYAIR